MLSDSVPALFRIWHVHAGHPSFSPLTPSLTHSEAVLNHAQNFGKNAAVTAALKFYTQETEQKMVIGVTTCFLRVQAGCSPKPAVAAAAPRAQVLHSQSLGHNQPLRRCHAHACSAAAWGRKGWRRPPAAPTLVTRQSPGSGSPPRPRPAAAAAAPARRPPPDPRFPAAARPPARAARAPPPQPARRPPRAPRPRTPR